MTLISIPGLDGFLVSYTIPECRIKTCQGCTPLYVKQWTVSPPILNLRSGARAKTFITILWRCATTRKTFRTYLK